MRNGVLEARHQDKAGGNIEEEDDNNDYCLYKEVEHKMRMIIDLTVGTRGSGAWIILE